MRLLVNTSSERKPPKMAASISEPSAAHKAFSQAGLLANGFLKKRLNKHGYQQSKLVLGLWKHDTRPIQLTLVVGDFGMKYIGKEHSQHLKNALEEHYKLMCNWTGTWYIGITLD